MSHVIRIGGAGWLFVDEVPLGARLPPTPAAVLRAILNHAQAASKEHLVNVVYGGRDEPEIKIVDVLVCQIRRALGEHRGAVVTVWGRGYSRGDGYTVAPTPSTTAVSVDAKLLDETAYASSETPEALVERLLRAEYATLWGVSHKMSQTA